MEGGGTADTYENGRVPASDPGEDRQVEGRAEEDGGEVETLRAELIIADKKEKEAEDVEMGGHLGRPLQMPQQTLRK